MVEDDVKQETKVNMCRMIIIEQMQKIQQDEIEEFKKLKNM